MFKKNIFVELLSAPLEPYFKKSPNNFSDNKDVKKIILFWNKESLGFLVSNRTFFRIIKQYFPNAKITLLIKNDKLVFAKHPEIYNLLGLKSEDEILSVREFFKRKLCKYDFAISPAMKEFSFINHLIIKFIKAKRKIGFAKINNNFNSYKFAFTSTINFNWKDNPDIHFSEILVNLLLPLGLQIGNNSPNLNFYQISETKKDEIFRLYNIAENTKIIVINNNSEDIMNKWDMEKVIQLISFLNNSGKYFFFFIGESVDRKITSLLKNIQKSIPVISTKNYLDLINIFSVSNLFVTSDSELMHLAGCTSVPQISIFGKRNPFNWAPLGKDKMFISKADGVNVIEAEEVFELSKKLLMRENKK